MKSFSIKGIVLCLLALVCCTLAVNASSIHVDFASFLNYQTSETVKAGVQYAVLAGVGVSSIAPEVINDFKLKYGNIKILKVIVVEELSVIELTKAAVLDEAGNILQPEETGKRIITPEESYSFLVRRPDRSHIRMLLPLAQASKTDPAKADEFNETAIKNLVVGGDLSALEDGMVYVGVCVRLKEMIYPAQSFLENA